MRRNGTNGAAGPAHESHPPRGAGSRHRALLPREAREEGASSRAERAKGGNNRRDQAQPGPKRPIKEPIRPVWDPSSILPNLSILLARLRMYVARIRYPYMFVWEAMRVLKRYDCTKF